MSYTTRDQIIDALTTGTITPEMAKAELSALAGREPGATGNLSCKIGPKGTLCVRGLNSRMPVTLYYEQWLRLIPYLPEVLAFGAKHINTAYSGTTKVDGKDTAYSIKTAVKSDSQTVKDLLARAQSALATS